MRFTRRRFLLSMGAVGSAALVTDAFLIEPNRLTITQHGIGAPAEPGASKVRLVQWTDLHLQRVNGHAHDIARETNRLEPDILIITGDSVDRADRLGELDELLCLVDRATPKYAILGNWEYKSSVDLAELARVYAAHNCRLLVNATAEHRFGRSKLLITGLDDLMGGRPSLDVALSGIQPWKHHLLLMHCPAYRDMLPRMLAGSRTTGESAQLDSISAAQPAWATWPPGPGTGSPIDLTQHRFDYMVSGHTHGGQITFFGAAPCTPMGSGRYVSGWYREPGPALYVSRGLGTTAIPARFCAPPEIAVFDWTLGDT